MKKIRSYNAEKYSDEEYTEIEEGIYECQEGAETIYVTSLSFEQEAERGEGHSAGEISQYPLEDLLEQFYCYVSDFYEDLNDENSQTCYLEFASPDISDVKSIRSIIGKHVYNEMYEKKGKKYARLVIE